MRQIEQSLLLEVIRYARLQGWLVYHPRAMRAHNRKHFTPLLGDKGFPDLVLCRSPRLIFAELKASRQRKPRLEQKAWLDALTQCGVEVYLWTPEDYSQIIRTLK